MLKRRTAVPPPSPELALLKEEISRTQGLLEVARANFNEVKEPDLVDCCIYEMKAAQLRYQFLLQQVKQLEA